MREIYLTKSNIDTVSGDILKEIELQTGKKRELNFKPDATALVVLDMQNYFLDKVSHAYIPSADAIHQNVNNLIQFAQAKGLPIIVTKHTNNETNARMMNKWWSRMIQPDSELSNISDKIHLPENYILIEKHQYDAFYETGLSGILEKERIETTCFHIFFAFALIFKRSSHAILVVQCVV